MRHLAAKKKQVVVVTEVDFNVDELRTKMDGAVSALATQLGRLRGSRPTPELFDGARVEAYGGQQPLSAVAQISVKSATMIEVACFDPELASAVAASLRKFDGVNPRVGRAGLVAVPFPRPSAEARAAVAKAAAQAAEAAKTRARKIRQQAHDALKKQASAVSEDDLRRRKTQVDKVSDDAIKRLSKLLDDKKADILAPS